MMYQSRSGRVIFLTLILFLGNTLIAQDVPEREQCTYSRAFLLQLQSTGRGISPELLLTLPPALLNTQGRQARTYLKFCQAQARVRTRARAARRRAQKERRRRDVQRRAKKAREREKAARQPAQEERKRIARAELAVDVLCNALYFDELHPDPSRSSSSDEE